MAKVKKETTEEKTVVKKEKNLKTPEKLTYEQLEQLTAQYYNQAKTLREALDKADKEITRLVSELEMHQKNEYWMRIDLLWRVLTFEGNAEIFSQSFIDAVAKEFTDRVFPPTQKGEEK